MRSRLPSGCKARTKASGSSTTFSPITKGDIVASLANGQVNEYTPSGTFAQTIISNASTPTGSAFDGAGNLYVTEFSANDILKVDASTGAVSIFSDDTILGDGTSFNSPESIAFGPGYTQMYVSDANRSGPNGGMHVIDTATGKGVGFLPLPNSSGSEGAGESDWLAFNHAGTLFMTNENPTQGIMQVDPNSGDIVQPSFVANLPDYGYAVSFDPNGNLWLSDSSSILEYDPSGNLINTITNQSFQTVFSAVFNPPYNTVYAGDLSSGNIFSYDLKGNLLNTFNAGSGVDGLSVAGTVVAPSPLKTYSALGDSYSSGEGDPPFINGTDVPNSDTCHRSPKAYPEDLAQDLSNEISQPLDFRACSGATRQDVWLGMDSEPSQLAGLTPHTNLVTIGVGGDDVGFKTVLQDCIVGPGTGGSSKCQYKQVADPTTGKKVTLDQRETALINDLGVTSNVFCPTPSGYVTCSPSLHELYADIAAQSAPGVKIFVLLYPHLFTTTPGRRGCTIRGLAGLNFTHTTYTISQANIQWLNKGVDRVDTKITSEVELARQAGIDISTVDPRSDFADNAEGASPGGHGVCTAQPWIRGLVLTPHGSVSDPSTFVSPYSFHPNATGHSVFADELAAAIG
jgi:GDSL-like Lipase/Acylhydrolase family